MAAPAGLTSMATWADFPGLLLLFSVFTRAAVTPISLHPLNELCFNTAQIVRYTNQLTTLVWKSLWCRPNKRRSAHCSATLHMVYKCLVLWPPWQLKVYEIVETERPMSTPVGQWRHNSIGLGPVDGRVLWRHNGNSNGNRFPTNGYRFWYTTVLTTLLLITSSSLLQFYRIFHLNLLIFDLINPDLNLTYHEKSYFKRNQTMKW